MNKQNKYSTIPNQLLINFFKEKNKKDQFTLLQVGCNAGQNIKALYEIYPNAEYYGVDILSTAIIQARENCPQAHFYIMDIEEALLSGEYDYILCPDILEHLSNPKEVLNNLIKLLKPDGYIFANIPNLMNWSVMANLILFGNFSYTKTGLLDQDHKHFFTLNEIEKIFKENNLIIDEIISIKTEQIFDDYKEFFNSLAYASNGNVDIIQYETFTYMLMAHKVDNQ